MSTVLKASFILGEQFIQLSDNEGGSTLHGGTEGFDKKYGR